MACLTRIVRFNQLKLCVNFARHLTSNNAPLIPPVSFTSNPWIWQKNDRIDLPIITKDPHETKELELPPTAEADVTKEAARLIVIRRNKMKRHKLKKLRKRMKFEWAKRRQRRELKKEKAFQAVLIKQCKDGEAFSAEKYVEERLARLNELTQNPPKSNASDRDRM